MDNKPSFFPKGAKALFIGHSFFIPIARQCDTFVKQLNKFPNHDFQYYQQGGQKGSPIYLWNNHHDQIEKLLQAGDLDLFGMTVVFPEQGAKDLPASFLNDLLIAYQKWIDLAQSYNPNISIFIGLPWPDFPSEYNATSYMVKVQEGGEKLYNGVIRKLRDAYPTTNIYFLDYGAVAGKMRNLLHIGELSNISTMIGDESCLYVDKKGHGGDMLKKLAGLSWLYWLYTADDSTTFAKRVNNRNIFTGNKQNIMDIYQVVEEVNYDYRLCGGADKTNRNTKSTTTTSGRKMSATNVIKREARKICRKVEKSLEL